MTDNIKKYVADNKLNEMYSVYTTYAVDASHLLYPQNQAQLC